MEINQALGEKVRVSKWAEEKTLTCATKKVVICAGQRNRFSFAYRDCPMAVLMDSSASENE